MQVYRRVDMLRNDRTRRRQNRVRAARIMAEMEARLAGGQNGDLWRDLETDHLLAFRRDA